MEERKEGPEGVVACDLGESRNLAFNQQLGDLRIVTASRATLRTVSRSSTLKIVSLSIRRSLRLTREAWEVHHVTGRHRYLLSQREYL
jgi:hypothetical protein